MGRKPNVECCVCEKGIYRLPSRIKESQSGLFRCTECRSKGFGASIECMAETCEAVFYVFPCESFRQYCSLKCAKESLYQKAKLNREKGVFGKRNTSHGYAIFHYPEHPNSRKDGSIFEHTFVMTEYLGRPLNEGEEVHHKNGVRDDNRIENLELWSGSQPTGQRVEDKIEWALEFLESYGYKVS